MRQEDFDNRNHRAEYDGQSRETDVYQRVPRCANCDIDILWPPIVANGKAYCCTGCAAGGPCCCDYSQYRSITISGVIHYGPDEEVPPEPSDE